MQRIKLAFWCGEFELLSRLSSTLRIAFERSILSAAVALRRLWNDLKPRLVESFIEAGKDVAVVAFVADFAFPALDQNVSLEQGIDASNNHGRRSISSSSQSKTTSTGIKLSVTLQMIPSRAAMRYGVMALLSPLLCGHCF
jgi:hypothetical protein